MTSVKFFSVSEGKWQIGIFFFFVVGFFAPIVKGFIKNWFYSRLYIDINWAPFAVFGGGELYRYQIDILFILLLLKLFVHREYNSYQFHCQTTTATKTNQFSLCFSHCLPNWREMEINSWKLVFRVLLFNNFVKKSIWIFDIIT